MDSYLDITLIPDAELPSTVIMNAVYAKFHKALCDLHATNIAISFPHYQTTLGNLLRLHGTTEALDKLQRINWIGPMGSYCQIGKIQKIPSEVSFRIVSRKQSTMSPAKLRRLIKRGSIS